MRKAFMLTISHDELFGLALLPLVIIDNANSSGVNYRWASGAFILFASDHLPHFHDDKPHPHNTQASLRQMRDALRGSQWGPALNLKSRLSFHV